MVPYEALAAENARLRAEVKRLQGKVKELELKHCREINKLLYRLVEQRQPPAPAPTANDPIYDPFPGKACGVAWPFMPSRIPRSPSRHFRHSLKALCTGQGRRMRSRTRR
jgi:hypothetical protein